MAQASSKQAKKKAVTAKASASKSTKSTKSAEVKAAKSSVKAPPSNPFKINEQSWNKSMVMDVLCEAIASSTKSIPTILHAGYEGHPLPTYTTVGKWISEDENLASQYVRAKERQAEYMAEEMLSIADDGTNDFVEKVIAEGRTVIQLDGEHVQRSRLRIETRKWLMGKLKPKRYGDSIKLTGDPENPLQHRVTDLAAISKLSDTELEAAIAAAEKLSGQA